MLCRNVTAIENINLIVQDVGTTKINCLTKTLYKMTPTILNCKNLPQINQYQVQKAVCVFELVS